MKEEEEGEEEEEERREGVEKLGTLQSWKTPSRNLYLRYLPRFL